MLRINHSLKTKNLLILMGFIGNMDFCVLSSEGKQSCSTQLSHPKHKVVIRLRVKERKKPNCLWYILWSYDKEFVWFFAWEITQKQKLLTTIAYPRKTYWICSHLLFINLLITILCLLKYCGFLVFIGLLLFYVLNTG